MSQPVTVENEAIRLQVWPTFGGKVSSIVDKADGFELMFDYPAELPTRPRYDEPFDDGWFAGWDECFPAVAPGRYPGRPYDGIGVPDHGELWGLPTTAVPTRGGITTVWHGLRFGYRLTRKLYLDGPTIVAEYTLINLAPFEFRFVWAQHAFLSIAAPVTLETPGGRWRYSHDGNHVEHQREFDWPAVEPGLDLSLLATLPDDRSWKSFSLDPITAPLTVRYPTRSRSVTIDYGSDDDLPAYWGVWVNTGGWGNTRNFTIEPTTGRFDHLDRAVTDGSAGRVAPSGRRDWTVRWTMGM
jgi:hypothetical protein